MICMKWFRVHRPSVFLFDRDFPTNVKFDLIVVSVCVHFQSETVPFIQSR